MRGIVQRNSVEGKRENAQKERREICLGMFVIKWDEKGEKFLFKKLKRKNGKRRGQGEVET